VSGVTPLGHEPLTPAVLHVLLALADGPLHGYAIMQRVEEDSGVQMGPGTVYGSIQRLERQGLVREAADDVSARRRPFELTAEGRAALAAEAVRLRRLTELVLERQGAPGAEPA
jgi:DNA-binding PadR family transcriptional regulator